MFPHEVRSVQATDLERAMCLWLRYMTQLAIYLTYYSILMQMQVKVNMMSALHTIVAVPCQRSHALCRPANIWRPNTWHLQGGLCSPRLAGQWQDAWWDIGRCHHTPNAPTVAPHLCTAVALAWAKRALWAVKKVWSWFTNGRGLCMQKDRWGKPAYSSQTALTNTLHVQSFVITSLRSLFTSCAKIYSLCFTQRFVSQHFTNISNGCMGAGMTTMCLSQKAWLIPRIYLHTTFCTCRPSAADKITLTKCHAHTAQGQQHGNI